MSKSYAIKGQRKSNFLKGKKKMQNISDIIEDFILETFGESESLNLSRNELANFFKVSPSQINYVLSTRFTLDRGFVTESKRGGGGYIKLSRLELEKNNYILEILRSFGEKLDYKNCCYILENLLNLEIINKEQFDVIKSSVSQKALQNPFKIEDNLRCNIIKNVLINLMHKEE